MQIVIVSEKRVLSKCEKTFRINIYIYVCEVPSPFLSETDKQAFQLDQKMLNQQRRKVNSLLI